MNPKDKKLLRDVDKIRTDKFTMMLSSGASMEATTNQSVETGS